MNLHKVMLLARIAFMFFHVLVFGWQVTTILAQATDEIHYTFTQTDTSYIFYGNFHLSADPKCLLDICFDPEHLIELAPDAREVTLTSQGSKWNQLRYTYRKYLFFENTSLWDRQLDEDKLRVNFSLAWSENNLSVMPHIRSSSGFYQITPENEYSLVEYYQMCIVTDISLTGFYIDNTKKEAINFLHRFSAYARDHCNMSKSIDR